MLFTLKENSISNLECSGLFCSGVVMAEKDKCGKFWPLGFVSAQLSRPGGWKACSEISKPSLKEPEVRGLKILQHLTFQAMVINFEFERIVSLVAQWCLLPSRCE